MDKIKKYLKLAIRKDNRAYFVSQIISLSFVVPFSGIIWTILYLTWAFNSPATVQNADWILSTSWIDGSSFLFVTFIWYLVTQGVMVFFYIYYHFFDKTDFGTKYGSSLLIFNGFIYSQFLLIRKYFWSDEREIKKPSKEKTERKRGFGFIFPRTALIAIIPIQFTLVGLTFSHETFKPTDLKEIRLSSDPDNINVIEIFSDGIDDFVLNDIVNNPSVAESFKDFKFYENFVTTGTNTVRSYNTLVGGFNHSMLWKGEIFGYDAFKDVVLDRYEAVDLINKYAIAPKFHVDETGIITDEEETYEIQTGNWIQAKDKYSGAFGTKYSPEYLVHKMAVDLLAHAPYGESSHVMINDLIYHFPYSTAPDGQLSFTSGTRATGASALSNILSLTIDGIKDFYGPAYDNSLILVYGDHASHSIAREEYGIDASNMQKNKSLAAIKYPNTIQNELEIVSDRTIFSPLLQDIITSNLDDPTNGDMIINTDSRFDMDQTFFLERTEGILMHEFRDGKLQASEDPRWNNGWISWDDVYGKYSSVLENEFMTRWYNDVNFNQWDPSVYKGGNNA